MIFAKDLYGKIDLTKLPRECGLYSWWATIDIVKKLCIDEAKLKEHLTEKSFFLIYIGIAPPSKKKNDIPFNRRIIKQHINGTWRCSTLRFSIASLIDAKNRQDIDAIIQQLGIEFKPVNSTLLEEMEIFEINNPLDNYISPLNLRHNNKLNKENKKELTRKRTAFKEMHDKTYF